MTVDQILSALEQEVTEDGYILLTKLREELDIDYWPEATFEAAKRCFGPAVYARTGRTYKALDRRIRHCLRVWREQHGPLNSDQEVYADRVLAAAIADGERKAGGDARKRYSFVQANLGRAVNHEVVQGGFKSRADQGVDIAAELAEAVA